MSATTPVKPPGIFPPPPGVTPNFTNPEVRTFGLYPLSIIFTILSSVCLALRLYTKAHIIHVFGWEDAAVIVGWMCTVSDVALVWATSYVGNGAHIWDLRIDQFDAYNKLGTAAILLNVPAVSLPKIAILTFYLRLNPTRPFRYSTYAVLLLTSLYLLSFTSLQIFGCVPISKFWKPLSQGHCINKGPLYLAIPITNMIIDVLILLLPVKMVVALQVGRRTKVVLGAIFAFSSCTVVVSAVRVWATTEVANTEDPTWESAHSNAVLVVELNMTVVCACVMVLRPFCRRHLPFLLGTGKSGPGNTPDGGVLNYDGPEGPKSKSGYRTKVSGGGAGGGWSKGGGSGGGKRGMWSGLGSTLREEDDDMESLSTELNMLPPPPSKVGGGGVGGGHGGGGGGLNAHGGGGGGIGGMDPARLEKWRHPENVQNASGESMGIGRESMRGGYRSHRGGEDDLEGGIVKTVSLDVR